LGPLQAAWGKGVSRVLISADAALASIPYSALSARSDGTHLWDDVEISHVTHAQDIVPWADVSPGNGALLVGGVNYERADDSKSESPADEDRVPAGRRVDRAPRGGSYLPLPGTRQEAEALHAKLVERLPSRFLLGGDATELRIRETSKGQRILHFATHAFSRDDLFMGLRTRTTARTWTSSDLERQLAAGHDPMLLSGLVLAGANKRDGGNGDDGILTALEASHLDLDGTELVVLSACETARGTAESGEGILGLVSAFRMAGARRVLATLWRVDDEATRMLMEKFYEIYLDEDHPVPASQALRRAALWLRGWKDANGNTPYAAPRYWAAFVCYERR
jgi:CHAT domain-containing protein